MVWTSRELIIWGGVRLGGHDPDCRADGARYDPRANRWKPIAAAGAPRARWAHVAVWTGTEMLIWGGVGPDPRTGDPPILSDGGRYDPASDSWRPVARPDLDPRRFPSGYGWFSGSPPAIWTGKEMILWGGWAGVAYDPVADTWRRVSEVGAPSPRWGHSLAWTGQEMLVWGGTRLATGSPADNLNPYVIQQETADGARYDPTSDAWRPLTTAGAPEARAGHGAAWTGTEMVIWGGVTMEGGPYTPRTRARRLTDGGRFDPTNDTWRPVPPAPADAGRTGAAVAWTGRRVIIWGGRGPDSSMREWAQVHMVLPEEVRWDGLVYDPAADRWDELPTPWLAPVFRLPLGAHTAVWTGEELLAWGAPPSSWPLGATGVGVRYRP